MLIKKLARESGFYEKHIRHVLHCLDKVVLDCFSQASDDEDIMIQLVKGIKVGCSIQPERYRRNPLTQEEIVCKPTCKPKSKFSDEFKRVIQEQYDAKNDG